MYRIYLCSPKAKQMIDPLATAEPAKQLNQLSPDNKYPLAALHVGNCFVVPFDDVKKEDGFRNYISRWGKSNKKKITVIKHNDEKLYEVARVG